MSSTSAYIAKLRQVTEGQGYKIQDTNVFYNPTSIYRGAAGCGPANFTPITYSKPRCQLLQKNKACKPT